MSYFQCAFQNKGHFAVAVTTAVKCLLTQQKHQEKPTCSAVPYANELMAKLYIEQRLIDRLAQFLCTENVGRNVCKASQL